MKVAMFLAALLLTACAAGGLAVNDARSLHDSELLDYRVYQLVDASSQAGTLVRAAYCSDDAVLVRNDAGAFRTNQIPCTRPARQ